MEQNKIRYKTKEKNKVKLKKYLIKIKKSNEVNARHNSSRYSK
tara:strand:- start:1600 stop:1728 length:129 start_codon:yes stop_codon:yes gene_type:complete